MSTSASSLTYTVKESDEFQFGSHLYVRAFQINIEDQIKTLANRPDISYLHLYCDTLSTNQSGICSLKIPNTLVTTHVYARSFLENVQQLIWSYDQNPIGGRRRRLLIWFDQISPKLTVQDGINSHASVPLSYSPPDGIPSDSGLSKESSVEFLAARATPRNQSLLSNPLSTKALQEITRQAELGSLPLQDPPGRIVWFADKEGSKLAVDVVQNVPLLELEGLTSSDLFDYRAYEIDIGRLDSLSHLLHQIYVSVTKDLLRPDDSLNVQKCISRLRFIVRCSRQSARLSSLTLDARTLLDRIELPTRLPRLTTPYPAYYAPSAPFKDLRENASSFLSHITQTEFQIVQLDKETAEKRASQSNFRTVIQEMGRNMEGFIDSRANFNDAQAAIVDCEMKRRDMAIYAEMTRLASIRFRDGIAAYEAQKKKSWLMSLISIVAELVVGVVVAVATAGAGAPLTIGTLAKAQEALTKGVETWDKMKTLISKVFDVLGKILPKVDLAWKTQERIQRNSQAVSDDLFKTGVAVEEMARKSMTDIARDIAQRSMPPDVTITIDYIGLTADWNEFDVNVDAMFQGLRQELGTDKIDGLTEFSVALKSQAVRGRVVIQAMQGVHEAVRLYQRQEGERVARENRRNSLLALSEEVGREGAMTDIGQVLRWNLIQDVRSGRRSAFAYVHHAALAAIYYTNNPVYIRECFAKREFDGESSAEAAKELLETLNRAFDSSKEFRTDLEKLIVFSTSEWTGNTADDVFSPDWKQALVNEGRIEFRIPYGDQIESLRTYSQVRIFKMYAVFEGLKVTKKSLNEVETRWEWELGPYSVDRDSGKSLKKPIQFYKPTIRLQQDDGVNQLATDADSTLLAWPSLFCHGRISFKPVEANRSRQTTEPVDLSNTLARYRFAEVTEVRLSFKCQGGTPRTLQVGDNNNGGADARVIAASKVK